MASRTSTSPRFSSASLILASSSVSFAAFAAFIELNAFSSNIQPNFSQ